MTAFEMDNVWVRYGSRRRQVTALGGVSLAIGHQQRWGIVGESGSGKTNLLRLLAGLITPTAGSVRFDGQPLVVSDRRVVARLRGLVQMVFQDPYSSLDPRLRVGRIVAEPLGSPVLRGRADLGDPQARVSEVLRAVGLTAEHARAFPHQLSGGQRQRVALARALAPRPAVLLADEPVSALDVSVRAHILNLLNTLVDSMGLTLVMVTHDLSVVRHTCDHVGVIQAGRLVESGLTSQVMAHPRHPYTRELLRARPRADAGRDPAAFSPDGTMGP
jgi:peptide/nickel transport system ATP-binding protein